MTAPLLSRRDGDVLILSNNNVAARNALSPEFYAALLDALAQAQADARVGAVVLTGEVMGTSNSPCCWPAPPSVALAATAMVMGISPFFAEPTVTVMPLGAPVTVPTVGVILVVP